MSLSPDQNDLSKYVTKSILFNLIMLPRINSAALIFFSNISFGASTTNKQNKLFPPVYEILVLLHIRKTVCKTATQNRQNEDLYGKW